MQQQNLQTQAVNNSIPRFHYRFKISPSVLCITGIFLPELKEWRSNLNSPLCYRPKKKKKKKKRQWPDKEETGPARSGKRNVISSKWQAFRAGSLFFWSSSVVQLATSVFPNGFQAGPSRLIEENGLPRCRTHCLIHAGGLVPFSDSTTRERERERERETEKVEKAWPDPSVCLVVYAFPLGWLSSVRSLVSTLPPQRKPQLQRGTRSASSNDVVQPCRTNRESTCLYIYDCCRVFEHFGFLSPLQTANSPLSSSFDTLRNRGSWLAFLPSPRCGKSRKKVAADLQCQQLREECYILRSRRPFLASRESASSWNLKFERCDA